jgi:hypothetical protein
LGECSDPSFVWDSMASACEKSTVVDLLGFEGRSSALRVTIENSERTSFGCSALSPATTCQSCEKIDIKIERCRAGEESWLGRRFAQERLSEGYKARSRAAGYAVVKLNWMNQR